MSSAMSKLPPEMLGKIFVDSLPDVETVWETAREITSDTTWIYDSTIPHQAEEYCIPFTISAVCRHWNEVALATPRLWSFIVIDDEKDVPGFCALETWLSRSGSSPLTLILGSTRELGMEHYYPISFCKYLEVVIAHVDRWEHLYIVYNLPKFFQVNDVDENRMRSAFARDLSAPLLHSACVCVSTEDEDAKRRVVDPLGRTLLDIFFSPRTKSLCEVYLPASTCKVLPHHTLPAASLSITKLFIHDITSNTAIALLPSCPNLQDLTLSVAEIVIPPNDTTLYPTVSLPHLHCLDISCKEGLSFERVLSWLNTPTLTHLLILIRPLTLVRPAWSSHGLRGALTAFFIRSGCHIASIRLHLYGRPRDMIGDDDLPLPLDERLWKSLEDSEIKGLSHPKIVELHSLSPVLSKMALGLPLSGRHTENICFSSLRQMLVRAQNNLGGSDYSALSMIDAPCLEKFTIWWRLHDSNAPNWSDLALKQLLSKAGNLTYLCLVCEPIQGKVTDPESLASYLLDILRLPNVNSSLQTLILCGHGVALSDQVLQHLTLSRPTDSEMSLPRLRDIVFVNPKLVSGDGNLADMIASRFQHSFLHSFYVHLDAFIGQALPEETSAYPPLHHEDERRLIQLKRDGRDVVIERGKDWDELLWMVEDLDERLKSDVVSHFDELSLNTV